jgi:hypothetical protein
VEAVTGSSGELGGCEHEKLRPYAYESKITIRNGFTVYHEDFEDKDSGWPSKRGFHYANGTYQIAGAKPQPNYIGLTSSPYSMLPGLIGMIGSGDPAEGTLVANGPWFGDIDASVSVELKSGGGGGDMATAGGLVFHLNDRGYYAVLISKTAPGSNGLAFKLVKKYHFEKLARDLLPWTDVPLSDETPGPQKRIEVQCRDTAISILVEGHTVGKFEDRTSDSFHEGLVGMVLYGTGRAIFRDLTAEEVRGAR